MKKVYSKYLIQILANSNSGVVSKDYATVNISDSKIINTEYCFQAYNKKKEFSGGQLISNKNYCEFNVKIALVDKSSKIILNNKNFLKFKDSKGIKEFTMGFRLEDKIKFHISDYLKIKNEIIKIKVENLLSKKNNIKYLF